MPGSHYWSLGAAARGVQVWRLGVPALADHHAIVAAMAEILPAVAPGVRLVLDLATVVRVHSALLARLVDLHRRVAAAGGRLALCGLRPEVRDLFAVTQTDQLLAIYADCDAAVAALAAEQ